MFAKYNNIYVYPSKYPYPAKLYFLQHTEKFRFPA